eukprot:CAMPEP_0115831730 /NCGR_PEP_ID=MMETSP0287-20121206/2291_1 /TAXON_ID=412157 /ORGANISM="Chrysochromulina rotalis, Strain UIO044" /LENGTH=728 /DNA_ID=CAMNT_0003285089 /DNA_START=1 /DNA_END=2187 /DNA_ORIENTATION=-
MRIGTANEHLNLTRDHLSAAGSHLWQAFTTTCCSGPVAAFNAAKTCCMPAAEEQTDNSGTESGIIYPTDPWKQRWDMFIALLILYAAGSVPVRIAFHADAEGGIWVFEVVGSLIFLLDLSFAFRTAYVVEGVWETRRWNITQKYLSGWFWVDGPSSIPVELLELFAGGSGGSNLAMVRMLRLFRLIRLLKLFKVEEYIKRLEEITDVNINMRMLHLVTLVVKMFFVAHLLGCGWFYMTWVPDEEGVNWLTNHNADDLGKQVSYQYLVSIYWALTTLTTVGYGDIIPISSSEVAYATVALLFSALVFSYIVGEIGSTISSFDRQASAVEEKMDALKEYVAWRGIPRDLSIRLRRYYEHYYTKRPVFDEADILAGLNPTLNAEVVHFILRDNVGNLSLFRRLNPDFQLAVFEKLRPCSYKAGETIFQKGDISRDLLFLTKGIAGNLLRADESIIESKITPSAVVLTDHSDGTDAVVIRGEGVLGKDTLQGRRRSNTCRALEDCEMFLITKDDLLKLLLTDAQSTRIIRRTVLKECERMDRFEVLSAALRIGSLPRGTLRHVLRIQLAWRRYNYNLAKHDPLYMLLDASDPHGDSPIGSSQQSVLAKGDDAKRSSASLRLDRKRRASLAQIGHPTIATELSPRASTVRNSAAGGDGSMAPQMQAFPVTAAEWKAMRTQMRSMQALLERLVQDRQLSVSSAPLPAPAQGDSPRTMSEFRKVKQESSDPLLSS